MKAKSTTFSNVKVYCKARKSSSIPLCLHYFPAALLRHCRQGDLTEERVDWSLWLQSVWAHGVGVGMAAGMMAGAEAESLNLELHKAGRPTGNGVVLNFQSLLQWHTSSTRPHLLNLPKLRSPTGDQALKNMSLWRAFSFKPPHTGPKTFLLVSGTE